jgi:hypothetical protein
LPTNFLFHQKFFFPTCNIPSKAITLYKTGCLAIETLIPTADVLVRQCIDGKTSAYRVLYDRYSKAIYGLINGRDNHRSKAGKK